MGCPPFKTSPYPQLIDGICKRYKVLPSVLLNMGLQELNWNILIFELALKKEQEHADKREAERKLSQAIGPSRR